MRAAATWTSGLVLEGVLGQLGRLDVDVDAVAVGAHDVGLRRGLEARARDRVAVAGGEGRLERGVEVHVLGW